VNAFKDDISLPLTSGNTTLNVVLFPLVNVKVFPLNDAVYIAKLADVFRDAVTPPNILFLVSCDWVNEFNAVLSQLPLCEPIVLNLVSIDAV